MSSQEVHNPHCIKTSVTIGDVMNPALILTWNLCL